VSPHLALDAGEQALVPPLGHGVHLDELVLFPDLLLELRFVNVF